jgi:DNA polymerase III subunit delta'
VSEAEELPQISVPLPWQTSLWQQLHRQLERKALPHALLFHGVEGTGKSRFAMALARLLLCREPVDGHNCGGCHACEMSRAGSHGDFRWLQPEDKSRVIKIDRIRQVVDFGTLTASFGSTKVIVIVPAETMNPSAANALLKSLEEPSAGTYMILVSHRPQGLAATLRSRAQQLSFPLPDHGVSHEWLNGLTGNSDDSLTLLKLAADRPLLAQQIYYNADMEVMAAIPKALEALRCGHGTVQQVQELLAQRPLEEALLLFCGYLQGAIKDSVQQAETSAVAKSFFTLLDEANRLRAVVQSGSNPNPHLVMQSVLAQFQKASA